MKHFNIEQLWCIIMKITLELEELRLFFFFFFGPHGQVSDIPQVQLLETVDCPSTVCLDCWFNLPSREQCDTQSCLPWVALIKSPLISFYNTSYYIALFLNYVTFMTLSQRKSNLCDFVYVVIIKAGHSK